MRNKRIEISREVREVLAASTVEGSSDRPVLRLPQGQLERSLYVAVAKVLTALGGKWDRRADGFLFAKPFEAELADALAEGGVVDQKKTLEQFFTPADLAGRMVQALDIREGTKVLEPSAGNGRLIWEALERGADVIAIEIDEGLCADMIRETRERMKPGDLIVIPGDFMETEIAAAPDVAIMNPPFSANQDIKHVCRALNMLRPGGKLAAIMSPHFTFASDQLSVGFRRLIGFPEHAKISGPRTIELTPDLGLASASVELLPPGTFKESGTNVGAVLVLIEKAR